MVKNAWLYWALRDIRRMIVSNELKEFKNELAILLRKHNVAIIAKTGKEPDDLLSEVGFQFGIHNKWVGRHHVTAYDLDGKQ